MAIASYILASLWCVCAVIAACCLICGGRAERDAEAMRRRFGL